MLIQTFLIIMLHPQLLMSITKVEVGVWRKLGSVRFHFRLVGQFQFFKYGKLREHEWKRREKEEKGSGTFVWSASFSHGGH